MYAKAYAKAQGALARSLIVRLASRRRAMEALVDEGAAKAIGVSNFSERQLSRLLAAARVKPVVDQVELHPLLSQRRLVGACSRKVGVAALSHILVLKEGSQCGTLVVEQVMPCARSGLSE